MLEGKKWQAHVSYGIYGIPPDVSALAIADTLTDLLIQLGRTVTPKLIAELEADNPDDQTSINLFCDELS